MLALWEADAPPWGGVGGSLCSPPGPTSSLGPRLRVPPGGHLAVPPVEQLQGLDVVQRDAFLQHDTAQVRRWELREDVRHIWEENGVVELQKGRRQQVQVLGDSGQGCR